MATRYGGPMPGRDHGGTLGLDRLPRRRSGGGPEVVDAVPDLDHHQSASRIIADGDVDRPGRIGGPCRELDIGVSTVPPGKGEDQLLCRKMPGIARLVWLDVA